MFVPNAVNTYWLPYFCTDGLITMIGSDGKPTQVSASSMQMAGSPFLQPGIQNSGVVTVMSKDGKPIQVPTSGLQSHAAPGKPYFV